MFACPFLNWKTNTKLDSTKERTYLFEYIKCIKEKLNKNFWNSGLTIEKKWVKQ